MDNDPLSREFELARALRITAAPPLAWIEAAAMIPSTLGDLGALERLVAAPGFRRAFAADPQRAVEESGLPVSEPLLAAIREQLA
jgi:hypothetical protein